MTFIITVNVWFYFHYLLKLKYKKAYSAVNDMKQKEALYIAVENEMQYQFTTLDCCRLKIQAKVIHCPRLHFYKAPSSKGEIKILASCNLIWKLWTRICFQTISHCHNLVI